MSVRVPVGMRRRAESRARGRCEYCLTHQDDTLLSHEPDHVIAKQHGGESTADNLAWACFECNRLKGPNISSVDRETHVIERLFNPRTDQWDEHFKIESGEIVGLTSIGRSTTFLLRFNDADNVEFRSLLIAAGRYPR